MMKMETKRRRRKSAKSLTLGNMATEAKNAAVFMAGAIVGTKLINALNRQRPRMEGLTGLDGDSSKAIPPSVTAIVGVALSALSKEPWLRSLGYGIASTGGAVMLQEITGPELLPNLDAARRGVSREALTQGQPTLTPPREGAMGVGAPDMLPDPTLLPDPVYIDDAGGMYDAQGQALPGMDGTREFIPGMGETDGIEYESIVE